jgi:hypothetical protein
MKDQAEQYYHEDFDFFKMGHFSDSLASYKQGTFHQAGLR